MLVALCASHAVHVRHAEQTYEQAHLGQARLLHSGEALHEGLRRPVVDQREARPVDLVQADGGLPETPQAALRVHTRRVCIDFRVGNVHPEERICQNFTQGGKYIASLDMSQALYW